MNSGGSDPDAPVQAGKRPWECPSLMLLGNLKTLVRGTGKLSGHVSDSDQVAGQKTPPAM